MTALRFRPERERLDVMVEFLCGGLEVEQTFRGPVALQTVPLLKHIVAV